MEGRNSPLHYLQNKYLQEKKMVNKYVTDYDGEYVVSGIVVKNGRKHQDRFWIPHTVPNSDHKKVAYVVGNGTSRINYSGVAMKLSYLTTAGGGHFGAYKGQCYGCNRIYQDWEPDFLVVTHPSLADEIVESGYAEDNIVFGRAKSVLEHPEHVSLIPHDPRMNAGATATYLACFHGHKKIYLYGFDNHTANPTINNNVYAGTEFYGPVDENPGDEVWVNNMKRIFDTYSDVDFVRVVANGMEGDMPEEWKWCRNFRQLKTWDFVVEADI